MSFLYKLSVSIVPANGLVHVGSLVGVIESRAKEVVRIVDECEDCEEIYYQTMGHTDQKDVCIMVHIMGSYGHNYNVVVQLNDKVLTKLVNIERIILGLIDDMPSQINMICTCLER